jgi:Tol biopolymer transport system component
MNFWLAPTSSLKDARPLETANVNFSNDGRQIVYVLFNQEPKEWQVVVEAVDGSESEVVLTADTFIDPHVAFGPGRNQLVIITEETLSLLDANDGTEKELLTHEGHPERLWFSPDGEKLVFGDKHEETTVWHWVDLTEGAVKSLDNLAGYVPLYRDTQHRWLIFVDSIRKAANYHFVSLNLESGEVQEVMLFDEKALILPSSMVITPSDDGRFSLIDAIIKGAHQRQLWLLDAEKGQARMLAEADGVMGAVSPDGQWVVVNTITDNGKTKETNLILTATEGEETRPLGAGYVRAWVRP